MNRLQMADCLALDALVERVKTYEGGRDFVEKWHLDGLRKLGRDVPTKNELADLRARAAGTTLTSEAT